MPREGICYGRHHYQMGVLDLEGYMTCQSEKEEGIPVRERKQVGNVVPCVSIAKGKSKFQWVFREFCCCGQPILFSGGFFEDNGFHLMIVYALPPQFL